MQRGDRISVLLGGTSHLEALSLVAPPFYTFSPFITREIREDCQMLELEGALEVISLIIWLTRKQHESSYVSSSSYL